MQFILGINNTEYKNIGAEIKDTSKDVLDSSNLITRVNCPSEDEINILKDNSILNWDAEPIKK